MGTEITDTIITRSAEGHLEYLSQTALEFVSLPPQTDIYHHIATRLRQLLGEAVIVVCSYDSETRELCQRSLVGVGQWLESLSMMAGTQLRGFKRVLNVEAEKQINTGRLVKVEEGLYEALLRSVPRTATRAIEKVAGVQAVYGTGCCANGKCFGSILMLLRSGSVMPPTPVLETFVGQAALALQKHHAEAALRHSEEKFRNLMEKATDTCLILNTDGIICDINQGGCNAMGHARTALIGQPISVLLDANELISKPFPWDRMKRRDVFIETRHLRRGDGTCALFESQVAPHSDGHVIVISRDITERRRLESEVVETSQRVREAMGRELHDSLGQKLIGISYLCASLGDRLTDQGVAEAAEAERLATLLRESVGQVRQIAQGLCPVDLAPYGISVALTNLASRVSNQFGVRCQFIQNVEEMILQDASTTHLYLIAQEATSNAIRHGRADSIEIELRTRLHHGMLEIRDNGCGFAPSSIPGPGLGLRIMKYRADMINGGLEVTSAVTGSTVRCTFPLPATG